MILSQGIPPKIGGISIIGAVTSFLGLLLGYRLVRAMHKSGNP